MLDVSCEIWEVDWEVELDLAATGEESDIVGTISSDFDLSTLTWVLCTNLSCSSESLFVCMPLKWCKLTTN